MLEDEPTFEELIAEHSATHAAEFSRVQATNPATPSPTQPLTPTPNPEPEPEPEPLT